MEENGMSIEEMAKFVAKKMLEVRVDPLTPDLLFTSTSVDLEHGETDVPGFDSLEHGLPLDDLSDLDFLELEDVPDIPVEVKEVGKNRGKKQRGQQDEMSEEVKREIQVVRMRHLLDPKHHYKAGDWKKKLPKNAQLGTVIGDSTDVHSNMSRRSRPKGLVDELLRNERFRKRTKAQYLKIQKDRARKHKQKPVSRHLQNRARRR